jgi:hypothetical protein
MNQSPAAAPTNDTPSPDDPTGRGLVDPRTIHPGPEGVFTEPTLIDPAEKDSGHSNADGGHNQPANDDEMGEPDPAS